MKKTDFRKKEYGTIIDELSSLLVMLFMTVLILVYAAYGKTVQSKLSIDNVAKSYLNKMEQDGYLSNTDMRLLEEDMEEVGAKVVEGTWGDTTSTQVKYGDIVTITGDVTFPNPIYEIMTNTDGSPKRILFFINVPPTIKYHIKMSATAKY